MARDSHAPDTITVTEEHEQEVRSRGAILQVTMAQTYYAGRVPALESAPMVRLRKRAVALGLSDEHLMVDSISDESRGSTVVALMFVVALGAYLWLDNIVYGGLLFGVPLLVHLLGYLNWPTSVSCSVRIRCDDAEQVSELLRVVGRIPGVELDDVSWRYEVERGSRDDWIEECIAAANGRAARVARALGVAILGVYRYVEARRIPGEPARTHEDGGAIELYADGGSRRRVSASRRAAGGVAPESADRARVTVTVTYRVGNYSPPDSIR